MHLMENDSMAMSWAYRIESMDFSSIRRFMHEHLNDKPTYITTVFGGLKLFRYLAFPLDKYGITHDGILFYGPNFHLVNNENKLEASEKAILRTYDAYSGRDDDYHELVRLTDSYGITKTHLVYKLVAKAFVCNPHNYTKVDFINGEVRDIHFQNLYWTV